MTEEHQVSSAEQFLHSYHSFMEIFRELSFREYFQKLRNGLKAPKDSGDYKWAKLQVLRLWAPVSAVAAPIVAVILLALLAGRDQGNRTFTVTVVNPEEIQKLEDIEPLKPDDIPPPEVDYEVPDQTFTEVPNPIQAPPQPFSPVPSTLDSVAIVKSPVVLKGIIGSRSPGARGTLLGRMGGNSLTEGAVMRALRWLKKNQNTDGSWEKTKPAMTALGLLTFLAHGETPSSEEFGPTVERAIRWLIDNQEEDGRFRGRDGHDYTHPIATYALCEAYALTKIPMVGEAAEKALKIILQGQHASGGWNYNCNQEDRDDTSYMGWCAQALKAASMAGVGSPGELKTAMQKAVQGFRKNYEGDSVNGGFGYTSPGRTGLTGVGVLCMQLLGASKAAEVKGGLTALMETTFNWNGQGKFNQNYFWYYITQARFHAGGEIWESWNRLFAPVLVQNQTIIPKAIEDAKGKLVDIGYWDMPAGLAGHTDGDVMNTTLAALQLQVYYRYLPTYKPPEDLEEEVKLEDKNDDIDVRVL